MIESVDAPRNKCENAIIVQNQKKITKFVTRTTHSKLEKQEIDLKVAKFWYSANLSFNAANLGTWRELCSTMRPGYEPPSEHILQGPLLDTIYDELRENMKNDFKGHIGTLIQDGWRLQPS